MSLQRKDLSLLDAPIRYARQQALEGVGEAGQQLFFSTEVVCEGEGAALQTAAAYLEAAGFCLALRTAPFYPGFWPSAWQKKADAKPCAAPSPAALAACSRRGFLGQLPCACPEGFDFWVLMGCLQGNPSFLFARGPMKPFLDAPLEALSAKSPAVQGMLAAWAALVFEKLALGLLPKTGGGSLGPSGRARLWGAP